jgi:thiazole synthase ThiGH ThiG subunit
MPTMLSGINSESYFRASGTNVRSVMVRRRNTRYSSNDDMAMKAQPLSVFAITSTAGSTINQAST